MLERIIPGWKLPEVPTTTIRLVAISFVQLGIVNPSGYTRESRLASTSIFHMFSLLFFYHMVLAVRIIGFDSILGNMAISFVKK